MSTPEDDLRAKLAAFEAIHPAEGKTLRELVASSPEVSASLTEAIRLGNLDGGFALGVNPDSNGLYNPNTETMHLSSPLLASAASNPEAANTTLKVVGHETKHAIDGIAVKQLFADTNSTSESIAQGPPPRDYTSVAADFLDRARPLEATAEIAGLNVLAAKISRENPGATQTELYRALAESSGDADYFDKSGTAPNEVYTPKAGITFNDQFQVEPTASNIEAFGQHFFDARYPDAYGQLALGIAERAENKAAAVEAATDPTAVRPPATVDLTAPGIGPNVILPSGWVDGSLPSLTAPAQGSEAALPAPHSATADTQKSSGKSTHSGVPSLSPASDQLLQDSERHVRRIAAEHGLPWDTGMDNTVYAMARSAKEAGMSEITHFKATNGTLRVAQHDGYSVKETSLDAKTAANTPAALSREQIGELDLTPPAQVQHAATYRASDPELVHTR